ncbi:type II toxin-antitoxin system RelE/ParE family toxin [Segetibacter aerophilus]|uniref:Plasmid stabilization protein n=1 Tax=Segetibacter aerophilus TaxID=670293 RepID=A0A512BAF8_9BACT|nr:type II toxin-antitoxin system RelE/ParE family toxin [Segetibacter aerophilus]GEO08946.1 hypothetical protein SAE01_14420 [Segetibacter aerophilus]
MAFEIVWSAEADNDLRQIVKSLKEEWSQQVAEKFILRSYNKLERLAAIPSLGRPTSKTAVYIYKLDRKNAVFFSLEGKHLVLLSIYAYSKDIKKSRFY